MQAYLYKCVSNKLSKWREDDNMSHCLGCHKDFNKKLDDWTCCIEHEIDDYYYDMQRGECPCGDWDCWEAIRCTNCNEIALLFI